MKKERGDEPIVVIMHKYMEMSHGNSLDSYFYLKQAKMSFFSFSFFLQFSSTKLENRRLEQVMPWNGLVLVSMGGGRWQGEDVGG
jgi:hypothetical protein